MCLFVVEKGYSFMWLFEAALSVNPCKFSDEGRIFCFCGKYMLTNSIFG